MIEKFHFVFGNKSLDSPTHKGQTMHGAKKSNRRVKPAGLAGSPETDSLERIIQLGVECSAWSIGVEAVHKAAHAHCRDAGPCPACKWWVPVPGPGEPVATEGEAALVGAGPLHIPKELFKHEKRLLGTEYRLPEDSFACMATKHLIDGIVDLGRAVVDEVSVLRAAAEKRSSCSSTPSSCSSCSTSACCPTHLVELESEDKFLVLARSLERFGDLLDLLHDASKSPCTAFLDIGFSVGDLHADPGLCWRANALSRDPCYVGSDDDDALCIEDLFLGHPARFYMRPRLLFVSSLPGSIACRKFHVEDPPSVWLAVLWMLLQHLPALVAIADSAADVGCWPLVLGSLSVVRHFLAFTSVLGCTCLKGQSLALGPERVPESLCLLDPIRSDEVMGAGTPCSPSGASDASDASKAPEAPEAPIDVTVDPKLYAALRKARVDHLKETIEESRDGFVCSKCESPLAPWDFRIAAHLTSILWRVLTHIEFDSLAAGEQNTGPDKGPDKGPDLRKSMRKLKPKLKSKAEGRLRHKRHGENLLRNMVVDQGALNVGLQVMELFAEMAAKAHYELTQPACTARAMVAFLELVHPKIPLGRSFLIPYPEERQGPARCVFHSVVSVANFTFDILLHNPANPGEVKEIMCILGGLCLWLCKHFDAASSISIGRMPGPVALLKAWAEWKKAACSGEEIQRLWSVLLDEGTPALLAFWFDRSQ